MDNDISIIDDLLKNYNSDDKKMRFWVAKIIATQAETVSIDIFKTHIIQMMEFLIVDISKDIRIIAINQILALSCICKRFGDKGINIIKNELIPLLIISLEDKKSNIRKIAINTLKEFSEFYTKKDQYFIIIWSIIEKFANDKINEKNRIVSIEMISILASVIGKEKMIAYAIPILDQLKMDSYYTVRETILLNLESICEVIGTLTKSRIYPIWEYLTQDEIWNVRKACVNSIVILSQFMKKIDRMELIYYFCKLIEDNVRWVKLSAYLIVGQFIITFSKDSIVEVLIHYFKELAISYTNEKQFYDCEMAIKCAFDFPAVLISLGKNGWVHLKETFITLSQDANLQTRISIASSLHIIATIIGQEEIENTLFPIIREYTSDDNSIKLQMFSNIAGILRLTTDETKEKHIWLIDFICTVKKNDLFWRFREIIATQLGEIIILYNLDIITKKLIPLVKSLLIDPVANVRRAMYKQIDLVITSLLQNDKEKRLFFDYLLMFATQHHHQKIIFSKMCPIIFDVLNEEFIDFFLPSLLNLVNINGLQVPTVHFQAIKALMRINTKIKNKQISKTLKEVYKNNELILLLKNNK